MRQAFRTSVYLKAKTLKLIEQANIIIAEYQPQGYILSIRQLYYQMVARGWIDNEHKNYKKLIAAVGQGRMNGLIDWDAIEDRVRSVTSFGSFDNPADIARNLWRYYAEDLWKDQKYYLLFLSEKDAVSGIVERACSSWRVPSMMCRGFTSLSALYELGGNLAAIRDTGKTVKVFHLGDHDPSGWDMTRDNEARLRIFMDDEGFELERIALSMEQVRTYNPPPAPAKPTDSRTPGYVARFGNDVWELDALEPKFIDDLIQENIKKCCDLEKFELAQAIEQRNKDEIRFVGKNYEKARNLLLWSEYEQG